MSENSAKKGISLDISHEKDCLRVISVEVSPEVFVDEKEKILAKLVKDVTIPGFRKGKAPKDVVKKRYSEHIDTEAVKNILPMAYGQAMESGDLHPIGDPVFRDIKIEEGAPIRFCIDVETMPVIELSEYKGLAAEGEEVKVSDEDVDNVMENLRSREASFEEVDREAAAGDVVVLDFAPLSAEGSQEEDKKTTDYPVELGSGQLFPEFESAVTGRKAGEKGEAVIEYPADFKPERLAGQKITYGFEVKSVKEKKLPDLDDAFASKLDENFKSLKDLRDDIAKRLLDEKEREALRRREEETIDRVIERNPFDVPLSMIDRFRRELEAEDEKRRSMAGAPPEEDEEKKKQISEFFDKVARRNIKRFFLIDHIARLEKVTVGDEEMEEQIVKMAADGSRPVDEVRKLIPKGSENYNNLKGRMREKKVFELLLGK